MAKAARTSRETGKARKQTAQATAFFFTNAFTHQMKRLGENEPEKAHHLYIT
jgi:hypothetical protein